MDVELTQKCVACGQEKPLSQYYFHDGLKPFKKCKECVKAARTKKPRRDGWLELSEETRDAIKQDLANRRLKITQIATKYNLKYPNLSYWVRSGKISLAP